MHSNITIRDGVVDDAVEVQTIASPIMKSFGLEPDFTKLDYELGQFGNSYEGLIAQLVACERDVVIGSVILKFHDQNVAKMTGFYISPNQQGKGVGKKLLNIAIKRAQLSGLDGIYLETWDKMEAATNLYKKMGWKLTDDPHPDSGAERAYFLNLK